MRLLKDYTTEQLADITAEEKQQLFDTEYKHRELKPSFLTGKNVYAVEHPDGGVKYFEDIRAGRLWEEIEMEISLAKRAIALKKLKLLKDYTAEELANITAEEVNKLHDAEVYYRDIPTMGTYHPVVYKCYDNMYRFFIYEERLELWQEIEAAILKAQQARCKKEQNNHGL